MDYVVAVFLSLLVAVLVLFVYRKAVFSVFFYAAFVRFFCLRFGSFSESESELSNAGACLCS